MASKTLTPPRPPLSGGESAGGNCTASPSPDKGRVGEGLKFLAYEAHLTPLARENRKNPTPAENLLWQKILRNHQFHGHKFLRQKPIGAFIADFYCAELKLVIEIDGNSHAVHTDYDARRTAFLENRGLRVLRYANRDILNNLSGVYEHLQIQLETS